MRGYALSGRALELPGATRGAGRELQRRTTRDRARGPQALSRAADPSYAGAADATAPAWRRSGRELARFAADERAEQLALRAEGTRLRNRATRIAAGGLVRAAGPDRAARVRRGAGDRRPGQPAPALRARARARAASAPACPRPARRRRPSWRTPSTLSAESLQRAHRPPPGRARRGLPRLAAGDRVPRPRPALPARQRGAGADEPGAGRRAPRAHASARSPASTRSSARCAR